MNAIKQLLKLSLISVLILLIVVTAVSFVFPSTVVVSRAININSTKEKVFRQINNFSSWKNWMEGLNDTSLKIQSANAAVIGSTNVSLTVSDSSIIHTVWENNHNKKMESDIHLFTNSSTPDLTVVQWQFVQKLKWYPWEKFGSLLNDKILGTMMERNLNKLKEICEQ
jgi:hypothetical protein